MLKQYYRLICIALITTWLVGCSNINSPVSVASPENLQSAAIGELIVTDVTAHTDELLYALGAGDHRSDRTIYRYNIGTGQWKPTSSYGCKISVTPFNRCYHINAAGEIWWVATDINGNSTAAANVPFQYFKDNFEYIFLSDIEACVKPSTSEEFVYVTFQNKNSNGNWEMWRARLYSGILQGSWQKMTWSGNEISVDPWNPNILAAVKKFDNNGWVGKIFTSTNGGSTWTQEKPNADYFGVKIVGNKLCAIEIDANEWPTRLIRFTRGSNAWYEMTTDVGLMMDYDGQNIYHMRKIGSSGMSSTIAKRSY